MKKQGGAILFSILVFVFLAEAKPQPTPTSPPGQNHFIFILTMSTNFCIPNLSCFLGMFKSCPDFGYNYADGYCDDALNTPECGYDGGDCCTQKEDEWDKVCEDCQCHTNGTDFGCDDYEKDWFQDGECDASLNNPECFYDGGDCCKQAQGWDEACQGEPDKCQCLDPFYDFYEEYSTELPLAIAADDIAYAPISCNDDEFERNGECVKRIKSQGNNKPFDLSIFGR